MPLCSLTATTPQLTQRQWRGTGGFTRDVFAHLAVPEVAVGSVRESDEATKRID